MKCSEEGDQTVAFLLKYFFTHHRIAKQAAQGGEAAAAPAPTKSSSPSGPPRERMKERERRERKPRLESSDAPRTERPRADKPRSDRPPSDRPRRSAEAPPSDPGAAQLWINLGAGDGIDAGQLKTIVAELSGIDVAKISDVQVRATHSYVFAQPDAVDALIGVTGKERAGKPLRVEKPRRSR